MNRATFNGAYSTIHPRATDAEAEVLLAAGFEEIIMCDTVGFNWYLWMRGTEILDHVSALKVIEIDRMLSQLAQGKSPTNLREIPFKWVP